MPCRFGSLGWSRRGVNTLLGLARLPLGTRWERTLAWPRPVASGWWLATSAETLSKSQSGPELCSMGGAGVPADGITRSHHAVRRGTVPPLKPPGVTGDACDP